MISAEAGEADTPDLIELDPPRLFELRYPIARIGESDWFAWWESHALDKVGKFALPRIFPRTAELSGAHLAIAAARVRHDAVMPQERLLHLFNLGELYEARFERWLVGQKAEGAIPWRLPAEPEGDLKDSVESSLDAVGLSDLPSVTRKANGRRTVALGALQAEDLENPKRLIAALRDLAGAYRLSSPSTLIAPYYRIQAS